MATRQGVGRRRLVDAYELFLRKETVGFYSASAIVFVVKSASVHTHA